MLLFALTPLLVPCACVDPGTNGTSDAAIDHTATLTADGVRVDFDLRVPDGATNVRLALGDGTTLTDPVQPQHLYPLNATLEVRLNWDGDRAGTVAETLVIDQNPVPLAVLGLPVDAPRTLVAVDHYGFNHNYDPNEPAYPVLFGASAAGWTAGAAGSTAPIANLSIDFYPSRDGDPVRHAVPAGDTNAYLDLMEPHVRIPNWYIDEVQVHAGGFSMPQVNGTSAPEPDLPKFLQNAHFPVDEPLGLALASSVTGAAHGLVYTLVGSQGTVQRSTSEPVGTVPITIEPAALTELGPGLVGVYAALYSQIATPEQTVHSAVVGYVPIWLDAAE